MMIVLRNFDDVLYFTGESRNNGETPILFSMELNGVTYQGILSAQSAASRDRTAMTS